MDSTGVVSKRIVFSAALVLSLVFCALAYAQTININTVTAEELVLILGILPSDANKIVAYRKRHGDYRELEDIREIPGLDEEVASQIIEDAGIVAE